MQIKEPRNRIFIVKLQRPFLIKFGISSPPRCFVLHFNRLLSRKSGPLINCFNLNSMHANRETIHMTGADAGLFRSASSFQTSTVVLRSLHNLRLKAYLDSPSRVRLLLGVVMTLDWVSIVAAGHSRRLQKSVEISVKSK